MLTSRLEERTVDLDPGKIARADAVLHDGLVVGLEQRSECHSFRGTREHGPEDLAYDSALGLHARRVQVLHRGHVGAVIRRLIRLAVQDQPTDE